MDQRAFRVTDACILLLLVACGGDRRAEAQEDVRRQASADSTLPVSIGPEFLLFDLAEYRLVDSDVVRGLGGRWVSLRYEVRPGVGPGRDSFRASIARALLAKGWQQDTVPDSPYVLSREYDTAEDDIYFRHGPFPGEESHVFSKLACNMSQDAGRLCLYLTKGW